MFTRNTTVWQKRHARQKGFTIIELLIATLVFSVILLVITAAIIQITRVYYKGYTETNTQNVARSIINTVSQAIQFSGGSVTPTPGNTPGTPYAFCANNQQFSYVLGYELTDGASLGSYQAYHGLVASTVAGTAANCASQLAQNVVSTKNLSGTEFLSPNMRLANLSVQPVNSNTNLWRVSVRVVYGDNDLLYSPSNPGSASGATAPDATCHGQQAGTQFCSVSDMTTIVVKRVQ